MGNRFFNLLVVMLVGGLVVIGSLAIARFCEEELTQLVPVIDPQAVEMYPERMQATKAAPASGQLKGALQ